MVVYFTWRYTIFLELEKILLTIRVVASQPVILYGDPTVNLEAATKQYVDVRRICNNVGLIPILNSNTSNRNGYIASASSEFSTSFQAFYAFNYSSAVSIGANEWATYMISTNFWIKIQLPIATTIWKFQLTGRFASGSCLF